MNSKLYVCLLSLLITAGAILLVPQLAAGQDPSVEDLRQLARVTFYEGRFSEAESYLRKSLADFEARGERSAIVAVTRADLGWVLVAKGNFREAERLMNSSLKALQKNNAENCEHTAIIVNQLGTLYQKMGKRARAERLFKEAVKQAERCLPAYVEVALNNLAIFYAETGKLKEATALLERALSLTVEEPGTEESLLEHAQTLTSLAAVEQVRGRPSEAEQLLLRAIPLLERSVEGRYSLLSRSFLVIAWEQLGLAHFQQSKFEQAELELRRARDLNSSGIVIQPSRTVKLSYELAEVLTAKGAYDNAKIVYQHALQDSPKETAETAMVLEHFSKLLRKMNADRPAEEMEFRAKRIRAALTYTTPIR